MRKLLLISHGQVANGFKDTLKLFLGDDHPFAAICAYGEGCPDVDEELDKFISGVNEGDEVLICSDIFGGSVNQKVLPLLSREKTYIIAGMNLAMLLQIGTYPDDEALSDEVCRGFASAGMEAVVYVNDAMNSEVDEFDE